MTNAFPKSPCESALGAEEGDLGDVLDREFGLKEMVQSDAQRDLDDKHIEQSRSVRLALCWRGGLRG